MIIKQIFYGIKCDRCGRFLQCEGSGGEHYDDFEESKEEVIEHSRCAEWSVINENECYCLDCSQEMESELCKRERERINDSGCAYQEADK